MWQRRLAIGAEIMPGGAVHFRVWAPRCTRVDVVIEDLQGKRLSTQPLLAEDGGYFSGQVTEARAGTLYRYALDNGQERYPDPASRFQPQGPHGPSCVIDPLAFGWQDGGWSGTRLAGQVIYELHVGTFTRAGTWTAAECELPELARLGITLIEMMPVAEFPGRFGWGYDGICLFAPMHVYGVADDLRRFIDTAHRHGLGVILDVVYNHVGPGGFYLKAFSEDYFTDRYRNEWGEAINFDGPNAQPVREFFVANARYWIEEFHIDGLRLDATQQIFDRSRQHILAEIRANVHEAAAGRATVLVAEHEPQNMQLLRSGEHGGYGIDALWNDDFHHSAMVAMAGRKEAYYSDYSGSPQELISAAKWGTLFQGQYYRWQKQRRGTAAWTFPPQAFVHFIQNHDQVANSGRGLRCHELTSPGRYRAITALLLLMPETPMLFQGQEFAASTPFVYFADYESPLATEVSQGRYAFLAQFRNLAQSDMRAVLPNPTHVATFERCKLDFSERKQHAESYALHRDLLALRRNDPVFSRPERGKVDGAVLGPESLVLRFFGEREDRLLVVNLGVDFVITAEPLLAPPQGMRWDSLWSSDFPPYGGCGTIPFESAEGCRISGHAAVVLRPIPILASVDREESVR